MTEQQQPEAKKNDFVARVAAIAIASIAVLFFVKLWIVDPVTDVRGSKEGPGSNEQPGEKASYRSAQTHEKNWSKFKNKITYTDAGKFLGQYVEIEGEIVSSHNSGKICYLNFDKNYKEYIALVIFADNFKRFPAQPEKYYLNKKVRVEGRVKDYKGRLEIILGSTEQIKVLDQAAGGKN
jgi:hypothetical protein